MKHKETMKETPDTLLQSLDVKLPEIFEVKMDYKVNVVFNSYNICPTEHQIQSSAVRKSKLRSS